MVSASVIGALLTLTACGGGPTTGTPARPPDGPPAEPSALAYADDPDVEVVAPVEPECAAVVHERLFSITWTNDTEDVVFVRGDVAMIGTTRSGERGQVLRSGNHLSMDYVQPGEAIELFAQAPYGLDAIECSIRSWTVRNDLSGSGWLTSPPEPSDRCSVDVAPDGELWVAMSLGANVEAWGAAVGFHDADGVRVHQSWVSLVPVDDEFSYATHYAEALPATAGVAGKFLLERQFPSLVVDSIISCEGLMFTGERAPAASAED
ncbi:MAG: hypothetical protein AAGD35_08840 [Actinomycetota bacterium]